MNSPARPRPTAEARRLEEDARRAKNWKRWGPYLAERQWGTVREDYSPDGECWASFPHDHARSRAYRWGEDGLLGITDRECRLCFALALWNGRDPILKERLFGLTHDEGNHGEDVKEEYFYLDSTPTHSYLKALYRYPQAAFPYERLVVENRRRGRGEPEFELRDTGAFHDDRFFDVVAEYAKASPDDILIRLTVANRGPESARLHLLPTLWFRNTWAWGCRHEGCWRKPTIQQTAPDRLLAEHVTLGRFALSAGGSPAFLFTENETNTERLYGTPNASPCVRDAFHDWLIGGKAGAVSVRPRGTKAAAHYALDLPAGESAAVRLRLCPEAELPADPLGAEFGRVFERRIREADEFHASLQPSAMSADEAHIARQAHAGLLWSKQFYHYIVPDWLEGDPELPPPPPERRHGRNADWLHLYGRDVMAMPDKWEYPWFAAWDSAFHMVALAGVDPELAKHELLLLLREWYMHPNGQIPAYEFNFCDVNPPVHAWACWRVYKIAAARGTRDRQFLARAFQKLLLNFTWWVNRKDTAGRHIFGGGFLGLDNIGVFDRSRPLPAGGQLEQADGTAWMAFYAATMLAIALELAHDEPSYEDMASKFFEHFIAIADAMNSLGGTGLWHEEDGFYYDQMLLGGRPVPLRVRSLVGLIPLLAVEVLEEGSLLRLHGFKKRMDWFLENRRDLAAHIAYFDRGEDAREPHFHRLLAIPCRGRLERVLGCLLNEGEFLSPYGVRSLSRWHEQHPFVLQAGGVEHRVDYQPGEATTGLFGGNSNWRGPVWFPVNYLLVEALERYHHFYGDLLRVECPTGSGRLMNLGQVADEVAGRLCRLFLADGDGRRPCLGRSGLAPGEPLLFHEYFHAETGQGLGASHQTGWTALIARLLAGRAQGRAAPAP